MIKISAKKTYFLAKCCVWLMLVATALTVAQRWRGARWGAGGCFADPLQEEYERQVLQDEARLVPGLGERGAPAELRGAERRLSQDSIRRYGASWYLSDRISYTRTLEDNRHPACAGVEYDAELPSASVVIAFHNEPYSALLRTVWNALNTARRDRPWHKKANFVDRETGRITTIGYPGQEPDSEYVYLKEIILVDDGSALPELRGKLSHYVRTRLPPGLVRLLRLPKRGGLTRARQAGAGAARGDALVVLDAHCEGVADWIRPLLQRIKDKRTAVLCPNIDGISHTSFEYLSGEKRIFDVGGFLFTGEHWWVRVPAREWRRRGSEIAPTWSPTMAGGLFALSRSYYWELGGYDEQMTGWGGENLEMSFRVWQCGGSLEVIPCSRVGHVFRDYNPYHPQHDSFGVNSARMAEVWMDEYAALFYLHRPDVRGTAAGDVSRRKALRKRLRCKSFQWFLDTVHRDKFVPVRDAAAYGRVQNAVTGFCLDSMQRERHFDGFPLAVYPCTPALTPSQHYSLTPAGQLRDELKCIELQRILEEDDEEVPLRLLQVECDLRVRGQQWEYLRASQQLRHVESGLCADAAGAAAGDAVRARRCSDSGSQRWTFDYDGTNSSSHLLPPDVERRLRRLRR